MVYVVDLEEESTDPAIHSDARPSYNEPLHKLDELSGLNEGSFAAALACYP